MMCERCGYSGCNHDWKRWTPEAYHKGFNDAFYNRPGFSPYAEGSLSDRGYRTGRIDGVYARNERTGAGDDDD